MATKKQTPTDVKIAKLEVEREGLIGCLGSLLAQRGRTDDVTVLEIRAYLRSIGVVVDGLQNADGTWAKDGDAGSVDD